MNFLSNVSAEISKFEEIREQLFHVVKVQLHPNIDGYEVPESFATYRSQGGQPLGVVGKDFTPTQPVQLLEGLLECDQIDFTQIKYKEMKGGSKIRFEIPLKTIEIKNDRKIGDVTDVYLQLQTGFDGQTKTSLYLYTKRLICLNGMKKSFTEFQASFKNTRGNQGKILGLCNDVAKAVSMVDDVKELYLNLDKIQVNQRMINDYVKKVADLDVNLSVDWSTRKRNIYENIMQSIDLEMNRTGNTAFGLLNGMTYYTNHLASGCDNEDFVFVDSGAKLNDKALNYLVNL